MITRMEWAVKLTWPDRHVEYRPSCGRRDAEIESYAVALDDSTDANAQVVGRVISVGEWNPAPLQHPEDVLR